MNPHVKRFCAVLLALPMTACLSIRYEPVPLDSAAPLVFVKCPSSLEAGQSCTALVQASQWISPTDIDVKPKQTYCLSVLPNQVWFDASRRNTPPLGEKGSWVMRLVAKREPHADFFSLIANTQPGKNTMLGAGHDVRSKDGEQYTPSVAGKLVFYPNDAYGSFDDPAFFYRNNTGQIWVKITRVAFKAPCAP